MALGISRSRVPDGIVGVDVDLYAAGAKESLIRLFAECGPLPPTWSSSSRDDGSGIYFYRVPAGTKLGGSPAPGIQTVQFHHRYALVWPSIHPEGREYGWRGPDGSVDALLDDLNELPELSEAHIEWLSGEVSSSPATEDSFNGKTASQFVGAMRERGCHNVGEDDFVAAGVDDADWADGVKKTLDDALARMDQAGGRHDAATSAALALAWHERMGDAGATVAIAQLAATFTRSISKDRASRPGQAADEWRGIIDSARRKVAEYPDPRELINSSSGVRFINRASSDETDKQVDDDSSDDGAEYDVGQERTEGGFRPDGHRLTDVGNSERFIRIARGRARYVHAWGKWIVYRRGVWVVDHNEAMVTELAKRVAKALIRDVVVRFEGEQRKQIFGWAIRSESSGSISAMTRLARGIDGVMVEHEELDTDPWLLNVRNGTVDLRSGRLRPHDPADLCTMQVPFAFEPGAEARLWEDCLRTWQPDPEVRAYLQRLAGAGATGFPTEVLAINYGTGGNGKSKFWGGVSHALGPYACPAHKSLLLVQRYEPHDTEKADLFRRRLVIASESSEAARLHDEKVKHLTGGDRIKGRRMREDPWSFDPTHTMVLFSNFKPEIQGRDEGIWRRLQLVPWEVTIPRRAQDRDLAPKLAGESLGILRWLVEGSVEFHRRGLDPPGSVQVAGLPPVSQTHGYAASRSRRA